MCGVAGWLDFGRDFASKREALTAMVETMACRGPDAEGFWQDEFVALGHRRLAVIDPVGGTQPMVAESDGRTKAVISYSGEVYNFGELRGRLESLGHHFRTGSDTEVVLRGYLEWGAGLPALLNGMFAFAVWDPAAEQLLLVRDRLGIKPLYYRTTPTGVIFGSEPKAILASGSVEAELDRSGLQELLTFSNTPGASLFRGIEQIEPGQIVVFSPGKVQGSTYWRLEARTHEDDHERTIETVEGLLNEATAAQTVSDVPLGALLSGGLDSSLITTMAADVLAERSEILRSFTVDFVESVGWGENDDVDFAEIVSDEAKTEHHRIAVHTDDLVAPATREVIVRARDSPGGFADMDASLYLLFRAVREKSTVVLSGEGADELFGGYHWFHDPAVRGSDNFPWVPPKAPGMQQPPSLFRTGLVEDLRLVEYSNDRYSDAVAQCPELPGEHPEDQHIRRVCALALTHFLPVLLERKDRISMALGLEVRIPYCDHRLVDYVFNVPWSIKAARGVEKSILKRLGSTRLPDAVVDRPKRIYPMTADPEYEVRLTRQLNEILDEASSPVLELIDTDAARRMAAATRGSPGPYNYRRVVIESLVRLDRWIQINDVSLNLGG